MPPRNDETSDAVPAGTGPADAGVAGAGVAGVGPAETVRTLPANALPAHALPAHTLPAHDAAWFTDLFTAHATAVFRYFVRRADRDEAEDLAADVLAVAWRRRDDVPDGAELPWLYRTAGFVLANHRRKGRATPVGELPDVPGLDDDDPAARVISDEQVREALAALSPRDRQILLLNAWEGLVGDGLAQVLGISRGGADAALSRARSRLRDVWTTPTA